MSNMAVANTLETRQDSGRLVAFSDGVVAIAITLLILPLADISLPSNDPQAQANPLAYVWSQYSSLIISFLVSWFVILVFWLAHHRMFGTVERVNPNIIRWNVLWLFGIIVLPFPMNLLDQVGSGTRHSDAGQQTTVFYIGTMFFISLMLTLMAVEIRKDPLVLKPELRDNPPQASVKSWSVTAYLFILLPIAWFAPTIALYGLIGLAVMRPLAGIVDDILDSDRAERAGDSKSDS
ncbi:MAG: TMEM175 family protein [Candidatus Nanopelagicales bacterium]